jgi:uncharacterized membrane protein YjjP (DUF1212 family)
MEKNAKATVLLETSTILLKATLKYAEDHGMPLRKSDRLERLLREVERLLSDASEELKMYQKIFRSSPTEDYTVCLVRSANLSVGGLE